MNDGQPTTPDPSSRAAQIAKLGALSMRSERHGQVHTLSLRGEIDLGNAADIESELIRIETTAAQTIVIDLSAVTFLESTAIRLLLVAAARARTGKHRLVLQPPPTHVRRVLHIAGVYDRLPFER